MQLLPLRKTYLLFAFLLTLLGPNPACRAQLEPEDGFLPPPVPCIHSHNDYEQRRPLWDALAVGACSMEADVFYLDGQLLVAHTLLGIKRKNTLEALYLEPLLHRVRKQGGSANGDRRTLILYIDSKTSLQEMLPALNALLERYSDLLTRFYPDRIDTGAVTVLAHLAPDYILQRPQGSWLGVAGGLELLDRTSAEHAHLVQLCSSSWRSVFQWKGRGKQPQQEAELLQAYAQKARVLGTRVRFWGHRDKPAIWEAFRKAGVQLYHTDRLEKLRKWMKKNPAESRDN